MNTKRNSEFSTLYKVLWREHWSSQGLYSHPNKKQKQAVKYESVMNEHFSLDSTVRSQMLGFKLQYKLTDYSYSLVFSLIDCK